MKFPENNIINTWLTDNGSPEIARLVEKNLVIAHKIHEMLKERGLKPADLARMLDKKPSEISKWLTGTHTFTTKTITKIETVLGDDIIHIEPQKEFVYLKVYVNQEDDLEETAFENSEVFVTESSLDKKVS
ncbi:helix-turn-helix transcriptional regulator [Flavobacterium sp. F-380]|uniref:Helix-turn-helix transcriptional regulator n=1 Tax=Flavobacterium kayseriense TaxID=2764714 RepID=A0ABR7J8C6_9FLAO|nr:helix-turn-helix transcriptional regulator [Flavobacterium kayseriense]MBC5841799.1 helix-turn-helix transcriptional regulator [Flavobacterium kayseriense]MBC5848328.1 helix-turn-helix transcriptional regulator [Flavobacterium kayseriense]